ncbi:hypothetical protein [Halorussus lipolyticus]|uniref:hypothetical protein n=1 Tax=Halorussus lipolyticus TaxID=3034024 RepID=UPI0023E82990|nr:hypothetical protein [Halorussus sp. DT80]
MASSRVFWISFLVLGVSLLLNVAVKLLGGNRSLSIIVMCVSGLGIALVGLYGVVRPDAAGGPPAGSPLTYGAVISALVFTVGLGLELL